MLVQKGHKILLQPNNKQIGAFRRWCGAHRWSYNFWSEFGPAIVARCIKETLMLRPISWPRHYGSNAR
jgi:hypothetical protein